MTILHDIVYRERRVITIVDKTEHDIFKVTFNVHTQRNSLRLYLKSQSKSLPQLSELSQRIRLSQHVEVL